MSEFRIDLHNAVYSLSNALDLVGITHINHGKRVAYIATEIAKGLGWKEGRLDRLLRAAILHDCGVSKTEVHAQLAQFAWEHESEHCVEGARLLRSTPLLADLAEMVRYHHTHWSDLVASDVDEETRYNANCIYLADRIDILTYQALQSDPDILASRENIRKIIFERRGTWFNPEMVDSFMHLSRSEAFWFVLERDLVSGHLESWLTRSQPVALPFAELRSLVHLFSYVVDAKSHYTKQHSDGVASLARYLGERLSLSERECDTLELAGLLHDIGKLRIPDYILEKREKLTAKESMVMMRHSFDTFNILKDIPGLEDVAEWATQHHERLDGEGYPYKLAGSEISLAVRIIAVADVFQALMQDRPYRGPMTKTEMLKVLDGEAAKGRLDAAVIACVEANFDECWNAGLPDPK